MAGWVVWRGSRRQAGGVRGNRSGWADGHVADHHPRSLVHIAVRRLSPGAGGILDFTFRRFATPKIQRSRAI